MRKLLRPALLWLLQWLIMLLLGALAAMSLWLSDVLYLLLQWGLMPVAGCLTACYITNRGLNNYLAWLAPPIALFLTHLPIWYTPPKLGPVLVCAFLSIVGAAAGEVLKQRRQKKQR